jgi:hypothetical protein
LEAITENRSPNQADLDVLLGLARGTVGDEAEDAAAAFLETTVRATATGRAASAQRLLALGADELPRVVRHRIKQHALQGRPRWALTKALRALVGQVLSEPLPPAPIAPPASLARGDRLHAALVAEAVAFFLRAEPDLDRTPAAVAARLLAVYLVPPPAEVEHQSFGDELRRGRDAAVLAADIREVLGPQLLRVLRYRQEGLGFEAIAEREQIAVSTAHGRYQAAVERVRAFSRRTQNSYETSRLALLYATAA